MKKLLSLGFLSGCTLILLGCGGGGGEDAKTSTPTSFSSAASSAVSLAASSQSSAALQSSSSSIGQSSSVFSSNSSSALSSTLSSFSNSSELQSSSSSISAVSSSSTSQLSSSVSSSTPLVEPEMVTIPAGSFQMGDINYVERSPVHSVAFKSFAMSKYEITFAQYDVFAAATGRELPSDEGWGRGNRPVINVSWNDATAYAAWLSENTGKSYRLPSEAEWEYATRAGTTTDFSWGNSIDCTKANYGAVKCESTKTLEVGSYSPNPWGLYDMQGNAFEWVQDCWNGTYLGAPADGSAWLTGSCEDRGMRGGSWSDGPDFMLSSVRDNFPTGAREKYFGFRIAQHIDNPIDQTPLLGAWVSTATCNWENWLCDSWLIFLSDKKYFSIQTTQPDEGCKVGVEMGTYTHHQTTGLFTPSPQFDSNDHCGVSDANEDATLAIHTNGSQFLYKETASSEPIALVKPSLAKNYQGTWVINAGNHIEVLQLIEGMYVLGIYDNGVVDVEQGSYSYDAITGEFKITKSTQDQNLSKGFSGTNSINFIFNASSLTITTDRNPSKPEVFTRLQ